MGMFNSISADLICPITGWLSRGTEIQIKWQDRDARQLETYRLGDTLDQLDLDYDNTWVRTDYICNSCSPKTVGYKGMEFIRSNDQHRHPVFVQIEQGKIRQILTEAEFQAQGENTFITDG